MSSDARAPQRVEPILYGSGMRVAVVCARFNDLVTVRLLNGVRRALRATQVRDDDVRVDWVPGALELPLAAKALAERDDVDAVICLGAVIRGETTHYDLVCSEAAGGIARVALDTGVPCSFGVLTVDDMEQALARSGGDKRHQGEDAARAVLRMAELRRELLD